MVQDLTIFGLHLVHLVHYTKLSICKKNEKMKKPKQPMVRKKVYGGMDGQNIPYILLDIVPLWLLPCFPIIASENCKS